ncbi:YPTC1 [Symbiodinium natans]|uniref:YPTC1 protein n=1 Tax=Symbiodinium natans TaxID=878477 RepID=A0A812P9C4_9DINO|nr:YPTC1 [Symbiodinium natans]
MGSGSDSDSAKKNKKPKKDKKDKKAKKEKKATKKDDGKEKKRAERALEWNCERGDAVRQIGSLLQLDDSVEEELETVFENIDDGETVRLDGLQNKQARKKLRHLLQAFRLTQEDNGNAYRSAEIKVSFKSIYHECLARAKEHFAAKPVEAPEVPTGPKQSKRSLKKFRKKFQQNHSIHVQALLPRPPVQVTGIVPATSRFPPKHSRA